MKNALVRAALVVGAVAAVAACSKDEPAAPPVDLKLDSVALIEVTADTPSTCQLKAQGTPKAGKVNVFVNNGAGLAVTVGVVDGTGTKHDLGEVAAGSSGGKSIDLRAGAYTPTCTALGAPLAASGALTVS